MAGAVGLEPTNAEIKTQCLTTWRRPICYLLLLNNTYLKLSAKRQLLYAMAID